jgi:pimeloyl-ACP methyl ester carboxylesterase
MSTGSRWAVALLAALACACGPFHRLHGDLVRLDTDCVLRGRIHNVVEGRGSVYVVVLRWPMPEIVDIVAVSKLAPTAQDFVVLLPNAPDYLIAVAQDLDGDEHRGPDEPIWFYGDPSPVPIGPDRRSVPLDANLSPPFRTPPQRLVEAFQRARGGHSIAVLGAGHAVPIGVGEIADLDAPRFSVAAGTKGLWEPVASLNDSGTGVFFTEPYDPRRLPVLFVNGAGGSPQDFRYFLEHLDRKRFQGWFFLYPSGLPLDVSARMLAEVLGDLHAKQRYGDIALVAHSMGGLVSRAFLQSGTAPARAVRTFATLSSPWHGHDAAALGVEYAPAVVPSWRDMVPGSPFQQRIFERPLDPGIHVCLGFTFHGKRRVGLPESNDSAVAVSSELADAAQTQASAMRGFDETHRSILHSPAALAFIEECLADDSAAGSERRGR